MAALDREAGWQPAGRAETTVIYAHRSEALSRPIKRQVSHAMARIYPHWATLPKESALGVAVAIVLSLDF